MICLVRAGRTGTKIDVILLVVLILGQQIDKGDDDLPYPRASRLVECSTIYSLMVAMLQVHTIMSSSRI